MKMMTTVTTITIMITIKLEIKAKLQGLKANLMAEATRHLVKAISDI